MSKSLAANITHIIFLTCMVQLVPPQITSIGKVLVTHITHMFVAGHCNTLMTVGWAWLAKYRICLVRQY
jgi:hypothetical protein